MKKLEEQIRDAVTALKEGKLVVFPTDTSYGLGGDFENPEVVEKILQAKGRIDRKFTLIAGSLEQVKEHFGLSPQAEALANQYWPGPLSIVVSEQYAVRVPDEPIARQLALAFGKPIIATSANASGQPDVYEIARAQTDLGKETAAVWIDAGELSRRPPSTIVRATETGVEVLRVGAIEIPGATIAQ